MSRLPAGKGSVGIHEVALAAQVSPATVSRVLNGSTTVRASSRRRVLEAAEQLEYRPNRLARNLRRQKADMIGVVVSDIENPHFSEAVRVIEDAAYKAGYRVLLCNTDETPAKQRAYLEMLADERALGVIISPADHGGAGTAALLDIGIPVVCFDRVIDDPRADAVVCDNVDGLRLATEHLLWLGHTRIAYLGGRLDVETGTERLKGYTAAMRAAGAIPFALDGGFRVDAAEEATKSLLQASPRATALVVANNQMTLGALRAIRRAGVVIPDDLALVAVDDPPWAELMTPPITAMAQPIRIMADAAMSMMLERVEGTRSEARKLVLPLELRIRASSGITAREAKQGPA